MPTFPEVLAELVAYPGLRVRRFTTGVQTDAAGAYAGVIDGADEKRQLVSTDLAELDVGGDASDTDPSWYEQAYAWLPDTGIQRQVASDGYAAGETASAVTDQSGSDEKVGVLTLTRSMGTAVAAGLDGEIHAPFPPLTDDDQKVSLRSWINQALTVMRMRVTVPLVAVENSLRYSLASETYLRGEDDLIGVRDRETIDDQDSGAVPGDAYLRWDGAVPYLILESAIAGSATFYVDLWRRRKTWIAVTGEATATVGTGHVTAIAVTRGGTYTGAPSVTITGGGGDGAVAHAVLTNGTVTSIVVDTQGTGYTTAPTITLSAGEFATSAVGLVNTDDVCTGAADDIAAVAYALIADAMSIRAGQGTDNAWSLRRQMVEERVRPYLAWGQGRSTRPRAVSVATRRTGLLQSTSRRRWA